MGFCKKQKNQRKNFRQNSNITRAEVAAIFARLVFKQKDETIKRATMIIHFATMKA